MIVLVRPLASADRAAWLHCRRVLWPETPDVRHQAQMDALVSLRSGIAVAVFEDKRGLVGLAEARLRVDYVNGCTTSPVAFLDGIFVEKGARRRGAGRLLVAAVADWARRSGCHELASDADLTNAVSHRMHEALGFEETERVVFFRKRLVSRFSEL